MATLIGGTPVFLGLTQGQLIGVGLILVSWNLFQRHYEQRKQKASSEFKLQAGYSKLSPFKHDVFKAFTVEIIPILLLSNNASSLLDFSDPVNNIVSRAGLIFVYFLVFYHFVEPYIANRTPLF